MKYVKVEVFIPEKFVIDLANALNERDFLKQGLYDYAFSVTEVTGYWRPLEGASPFDGEIGVVSREPEIKMEFRIDRDDLEEVNRIIRFIHPYECPVINYIEVLDME